MTKTALCVTFKENALHAVEVMLSVDQVVQLVQSKIVSIANLLLIHVTLVEKD